MDQVMDIERLNEFNWLNKKTQELFGWAKKQWFG